MTGNRAGPWVLGLIILVGTALRLVHLGWSLPHAYEEAKPLHVAFQMWGWDRGIAVSLDPAFFNYPSLVLYLHFIVQGLLYLALKLSGSIHSVVDWQVLYLTDPSILYRVERAATVLFAAGTIWQTARLGRLLSGWVTGLLAALFLALDPFHIARSQMIEVDVPLTFFATWALVESARLADDGTRRRYVLAGVAIGLAASCKYTGFLLVVPLAVVHVLGRRSTRPLRELAIALGVAALAFACTSPYVLIDGRQFWHDFSLERAHMAEGHFGLSHASSWTFYAGALAGGAVSFAMSVMAVIGVAALAVRRRQRAAITVLAFAMAYLVIISTWKMRADRYLLPVIPMVAVFAAAAVTAIGRWSRDRGRAGAATACVIAAALCALDLGRYAQAERIAHDDARTAAAAWIEFHIPAGAFIVEEHYGPDLIAPPFLLQLDPVLRQKVMARLQRPVYAVQTLPMTQTRPEQSAAFYALDLYPCADYVIVSSAIRDRYRREPSRFAEQLRFYQRLDAEMQRVQDFTSTSEGGINLTLYRRARREAGIARTDSVPPPPVLPYTATRSQQAPFYYELGADYEYYGHAYEAYVSYRRALDRGMGNRQLFLQCVLGAVRTLVSTRQNETAIRFLEQVSGAAPDEDARRVIEAMRRTLVEQRARR